MIILLQYGYCGDETFQFAGQSSKEYLFKWDKKLTAYTFRPTCQEDADDIFKQNGTMWQLTALCDGPNNDETPTAAVVKGAPKPSLPARYYADLDADELAEMARSSGIADAKETDGKPLLMRVLGAYFLGAGLMRENPARAAELVKTRATPPPVPLASSVETFGTGEGKIDVVVDRLQTVPISAKSFTEMPPAAISGATGKPVRKYVKNPRGPLVAATA